MGDEYLVKTHIFEGPLDTLLSLIEKRKLFINDISLAQVADDYIAYVNSLENYSIADTSHFILIASTLVLIKSKSLLPDLTLTEEEQDSIEDLEDRLKQYQKYKNLSVHLKERFGINVEYLRLPSKEKKIVFTPDRNISLNRIFDTVKFVLSNIPKKEFVPKAIIQKVITLEEMMESLTDRITKSMKMSFKDFSGHGKADPSSRAEHTTGQAKLHVIVSFLAMLELVKQGIINVKQEADFQDIEIETQSVGVPRY